MWFKNVFFMRFIKPFTMTAEQLAEGLAGMQFRECGERDTKTEGFISPIKGGEMLVHTAMNCHMVCFQIEQKTLKASALNRLVDKQVRAFEDKEGRTVGRKERAAIKDEILLEKLPKQEPDISRHYGYIDVSRGLLVIEAGTANAADYFVGSLRYALGSLSVVPATMNDLTSPLMTGWLHDRLVSPGFDLGGDCVLEDNANDSARVTFKGEDLLSDEVHAYLQASRHVSKLALFWDESVSFDLLENVSLKRVKFADSVIDKSAESDPEDLAQLFDADFVLMSDTLGRLFEALAGVLGGEASEEVLAEKFTLAQAEAAKAESVSVVLGGDGKDPLYDDAVRFVCETNRASISAQQRKLRIGYNRSARLIEAMEARYVVSAMGEDGVRDVICCADLVEDSE